VDECLLEALRDVFEFRPFSRRRWNSGLANSLRHGVHGLVARPMNAGPKGSNNPLIRAFLTPRRRDECERRSKKHRALKPLSQHQ
jgi:hypothetical protein